MTRADPRHRRDAVDRKLIDRLLGNSPVLLTPLESFENTVFLAEEPECRGRRSVIRISRRIERNLPDVECELEFVRFLAATGVRVPEPLGSAVEEDDAVAARFAHLPGTHLSTATADEAAAAELGRTVGELHAAARRFPPHLAARRRPWWDEEYFSLDHIADAADARLISAARELIDEVRAHSAEEFIAHGDLNFSNLLFGRALHVIDFDDSCRADAEFDLAVLLVRIFAGPEGSADDIRRIVPSLMRGYRAGPGREVDVRQVDRYLRILLVQTAIIARRVPGCPGLTVAEALARAYAAVGPSRELPPKLRLALACVAPERRGDR